MEHRQKLRQLIDGYRHTALLYVAAKLRLPDLLLGGPERISQLVLRLSVNEDLLERLLRGLAVLGIVREESDRGYSLTELGAGLCSESPGSLGEGAIIAGEEYLPAWGSLLHTLRTGEPAFDHVFGMTVWEHRRQNPELNRSFNIWLREETASTANSILRAYDFAEAHLVADVGGGQGGLLSALLLAHPRLNGILIDLPHVVDHARKALQEAGVSDRCRIYGGDFFVSIPEDADIYLLKSVLHDWNDDQCRNILRVCRKAMSPTARLLVIERPLPESPENDPATVMLDLHMLAVLGGRERFTHHYRTLASMEGLALHRILPTEAGLQVMEFRLA